MKRLNVFNQILAFTMAFLLITPSVFAVKNHQHKNEGNDKKKPIEVSNEKDKKKPHGKKHTDEDKNLIPSDKTVVTSAVETENVNGGFLSDVIFWDERGYCEYIAYGKSTLGIDLNIQNYSYENEIIQPYFALYDGNRLSETKMLAFHDNANNEVDYYSDKIILDSHVMNNYIAKVFVWKNDNLEPLNEIASVSTEKADYYGNSITDSTFVFDLGKEITGCVNTQDDVDCFKITPEKTDTFSINCFSASDIDASLHNANGSVLKTDSSSIEYSLTEGNVYYIRLSGDVGDYVLTINDGKMSIEDSFDIYDFDEDVNVYKNSILKICDDLYISGNEILSKQMYDEYEAILNDDAKLHELPTFLSDHPKDLSEFDDLLNEYYATKLDKFEEIKGRYIALIDKYAEFCGSEEVSEAESQVISEILDNRHPIFETITPIEIQSANEQNNWNEYEIELAFEPSLSIISTTETSITYNAVFPRSDRWGNTVFIQNYNTQSGLTTWKNAYGNDESRDNGQYTISGLSPGGIYLLALCWSTNGESYGGENTIFRFVQLPDNSSENLVEYSCPDGRVKAHLEEEDKDLATSEDFNTWLERMEEVYYAYKELTGYTPFNSRMIEMTSTRQNLNKMFDVVDGQNYYTIVFGYYDGTNVFKYSRAFYQSQMRRLSKDDWGDTPMHELSHVFDNDKWVFDSETLAQFKMYYIMDQVDGVKFYEPNRFDSGTNGWYSKRSYYDLLKSHRYLDGYDDSFGTGRYASEGFAVILIDIQKEIGWRPFKKTFRYFSELSDSQIPSSEGEKLKLFLTKLKDYSGEDVLDMIKRRDTGIIEDWYDITLDYVEAPYPNITENNLAGGCSAEISADKGSYAVRLFTPTESGNYFIYTSPYGESGVSNDTYIEVYTNTDLSGTPIASNDDYDGGRFSKVEIPMTDGTTYYIKVGHYGEGKLHADLNITEIIPVESLTLDENKDIIVSKGEFALFSFTPVKSMTYVFDVSNYNGETTEYDAYIKLYGNQSMTQRIGQGNQKLIVNLKENNTYYLQFSGYLMRYARGRVNIREGQTVEFSKKTDSSFIYVNSPEYITRYDIVDSEYTHNLKLFEQENVTGKNTYYQTQTGGWWGNPEYIQNFAPTSDFYVDIDFYNPTSYPVTITVQNLAYGTHYGFLEYYYNGGVKTQFLIPAGEHALLFESLDAPLLCSEPSENEWIRTFVILFDFEVTGGEIVISSLASYDRNNLYLENGTKNEIASLNTILDSGEIIYETDGDGNPIWGTVGDPRLNEYDLYGKYKGIARNQSAWVDSSLEFAIDDLTPNGKSLDIYLKDDYYSNNIANPKKYWMTNINPFNDQYFGLIYGLPSSNFHFTYHRDVGGIWNFKFDYRNLKHITDTALGNESINDPIPTDIIEDAKADVAIGWKAHFSESAPDPDSISLGGWGATHHYTITITNDGMEDRSVSYRTTKFANMVFGYKMEGEDTYNTKFNSGGGLTIHEKEKDMVGEYIYVEDYKYIIEDTLGQESELIKWWIPFEIDVPAKTTVTFEIVTTIAAGVGGTHNDIYVH